MDLFKCESNKLAAFLILKDCKLQRIEPETGADGEQLYIFYFFDGGRCGSLCKEYTRIKRKS